MFSKMHYKPDPIVIGERDFRHVKFLIIFRIHLLKKYGVKNEGTEIMEFIVKKLCNGILNYRKENLLKQTKMERHLKIYHTKIDILKQEVFKIDNLIILSTLFSLT